MQPARSSPGRWNRGRQRHAVLWRGGSREDKRLPPDSPQHSVHRREGGIHRHRGSVLGQAIPGFAGQEESIKNLLIFQVHSFEEQSDRIDKIEKLAAAGSISLVVIDSLTMFYRLNHDDPSMRNDFIRQTEVLLNTARQYEIAIMVTSQVYANLSTGGVEFLGGHALHHNAKTIIRLDKRFDGRREAVIMKHRSLPEGRKAQYRITETGIEDV